MRYGKPSAQQINASLESNAELIEPALASRRGAMRPRPVDQPPLSMHPYLTQSFGLRLRPSVSGFLGAGT
jgi:hypothetical protein